MTSSRLLQRLLPFIAAIALGLLIASCAPQKQYGCPNHLESNASVE
jgi:hypothetical protein